MKKFLSFLLLSTSLAAAPDNVLNDPDSGLAIYPIKHASMVITAGAQTVYVDPVGGAEAFQNHPKPTTILVTDIHKDQLDKDTIDKLRTERTRILAPKAVIDRLGYGRVMENGGTLKDGEIDIEAVPMYNTTPEREDKHPRGRGNGYLLSYKGKRIYISGDTEDIPEMRDLKNIDYAFLCMDAPHTMSPEQAASAVLAFKPKTAIPYQFRGGDAKKFRQLVNEGNQNIQVVLLDWYPEPE